jgi:hypothetical protein
LGLGAYWSLSLGLSFGGCWLWGHRHLLVEHPKLLPMHQFVAAKQM